MSRNVHDYEYLDPHLDQLERAVKQHESAADIYRRRLVTECSAEPDGQLARDLRRCLERVTR